VLHRLRNLTKELSRDNQDSNQLPPESSVELYRYVSLLRVHILLFKNAVSRFL
jgi:hypothetical protein